MKQIAKGAIIRSKATWYEKGEKSNKYFLYLETHKKAKSSVRKVFNREGVLITDPKKILQETYNQFYSNLCKQDPLSPSEDILNSFLSRRFHKGESRIFLISSALLRNGATGDQQILHVTTCRKKCGY